MAAAQSVNFAKEGSATEQLLKKGFWSNILFSLRNIQKQCEYITRYYFQS